MDWMVEERDGREGLLALLPDSIDAIITDPPYGIAKGAAFFHGGAVSDDTAQPFNATDDLLGWIGPAARALAPGGHLAFFSDRAVIEAALAAMRYAGLSEWHRFYIVKSNPSPTPRPAFANAVEECLIAEKRAGKRRWHGGGSLPNRWYGAPDQPDDTFTRHPAQKPLDAMRMLVRGLVPRGGLVVDPFCGSGTTGCAAIQEGCRFTGFERVEAYADLARRRIAYWSTVATPTLFVAPTEAQAKLVP